MLIADDYQRAIDTQSACNLSGVVYEFAKVMKKICEEESTKGTERKNKHPICRLYAEQILYLTGGAEFESYTEALQECELKRVALEKIEALEQKNW